MGVTPRRQTGGHGGSVPGRWLPNRAPGPGAGCSENTKRGVGSRDLLGRRACAALSAPGSRPQGRVLLPKRSPLRGRGGGGSISASRTIHSGSKNHGGPPPPWGSGSQRGQAPPMCEAQPAGVYHRCECDTGRHSCHTCDKPAPLLGYEVIEGQPQNRQEQDHGDGPAVPHGIHVDLRVGCGTVRDATPRQATLSGRRTPQPPQGGAHSEGDGRRVDRVPVG